MVLPRSVARFNRRVTNRVLGKLALVLPGWAMLTHTGRRSGKTYQTPVNVFARPGGYVIALTYGRQSDWVRNVLAAGGAQLRTRGRTERLTDPELVHDPRGELAPWLPRQVLKVVGVSDYLTVRIDRT